MKIRKYCFAVISLCILVFLILLYPVDFFQKGFYCNVIDYEKLNVQDFRGYWNLSEGDYQLQFMPMARHFAGFEINLINLPEDSKGTLVINTFSSDEQLVDSVEVDLAKVSAAQWYVVKTDGKYKKGDTYRLEISAVNYEMAPYLQFVHKDYLQDENLGNELLIGYGYTQSIFSTYEKVFLGLGVCIIWVFLFGELFLKGRKKECWRTVSIYMGLVFLLSIAYAENSFDNSNTMFDTYQKNSEALVTSMITAEEKGVATGKWGLGIWSDAAGERFSYPAGVTLNYGEWDCGYNVNEPKIAVIDTAYNRRMASVGNSVVFENGDSAIITEIVSFKDDKEWLILSLDTAETLSVYKNGEIDTIKYCEAGKYYDGELSSYNSQYGLQGKIFRHIARLLEENSTEWMNLLCAILAACVFALITLLIYKKYSLLLAGCFYFTFLLSPWIVAVARNLYWVEFTWFLPMAVGLVCSLSIEKKSVRVFCYFCAFVTVAVKCLCGYEYITTIMMSMIAFLLVDFVVAISRKEKAKCMKVLITIFMLGCSALAAFFAVLLFHSYMLGEGSISLGFKYVLENLIQRRVGGGDLNSFSENYWVVENGSAWQALKKFFHMETQIVVGIDGNLFPLLCLSPVLIFCYDYFQKKNNIELVALYCVFFVACISWFVLAKSHSLAHGTLNWQMWYFGFVQICFYIILEWITHIKRESK